MGATGQTKVPEADLCLRCGLGVQAYPKKDKHAIAHEIDTRPKFEAEWRMVCDRVGSAVQRLLDEQSVEKHDDIGYEAYVKMAFVLGKYFTARWMPAENMNFKIAVVANPEGGPDLTGILMDKKDLDTHGKGLPYYTIKLWARRFTSLRTMFVSPQDLAHQKQAADVFATKVAADIAGRATTMTLSMFPNLETIPSTEAKFQAVQDALKKAAADRALQQGAIDGGLSREGRETVRRLVAGREVPTESETPGGKPKRPKTARRRRSVRPAGRISSAASLGKRSIERCQPRP